MGMAVGKAVGTVIGTTVGAVVGVVIGVGVGAPCGIAKALTRKGDSESNRPLAKVALDAKQWIFRAAPFPL